MTRLVRLWALLCWSLSAVAVGQSDGLWVDVRLSPERPFLGARAVLLLRIAVREDVASRWVQPFQRPLAYPVLVDAPFLVEPDGEFELVDQSPRGAATTVVSGCPVRVGLARSEEVDGIAWRVLTLPYAWTVTRAMTIPAIDVRVRVAETFSQNFLGERVPVGLRTLRAVSVARTVAPRSIPATGRPSSWREGAVGRFAVEARWVRTDGGVTATLEVAVTGLPGGGTSPAARPQCVVVPRVFPGFGTRRFTDAADAEDPDVRRVQIELRSVLPVDAAVPSTALSWFDPLHERFETYWTPPSGVFEASPAAATDQVAAEPDGLDGLWSTEDSRFSSRRGDASGWVLLGCWCTGFLAALLGCVDRTRWARWWTGRRLVATARSQAEAALVRDAFVRWCDRVLRGPSRASVVDPALGLRLEREAGLSCDLASDIDDVRRELGAACFGGGARVVDAKRLALMVSRADRECAVVDRPRRWALSVFVLGVVVSAGFLRTPGRSPAADTPHARAVIADAVGELAREQIPFPGVDIESRAAYAYRTGEFAVAFSGFAAAASRAGEAAELIAALHNLGNSALRCGALAFAHWCYVQNSELGADEGTNLAVVRSRLDLPPNQNATVYSILATWLLIVVILGVLWAAYRPGDPRRSLAAFAVLVAWAIAEQRAGQDRYGVAVVRGAPATIWSEPDTERAEPREAVSPGSVLPVEALSDRWCRVPDRGWVPVESVWACQ